MCPLRCTPNNQSHTACHRLLPAMQSNCIRLCMRCADRVQRAATPAAVTTATNGRDTRYSHTSTAHDPISKSPSIPCPAHAAATHSSTAVAVTDTHSHKRTLKTYTHQLSPDPLCPASSSALLLSLPPHKPPPLLTLTLLRNHCHTAHISLQVPIAACRHAHMHTPISHCTALHCAIDTNTCYSWWTRCVNSNKHCFCSSTMNLQDRIRTI